MFAIHPEIEPGPEIQAGSDIQARVWPFCINRNWASNWNHISNTSGSWIHTST